MVPEYIAPEIFGLWVGWGEGGIIYCARNRIGAVEWRVAGREYIAPEIGGSAGGAGTGKERTRREVLASVEEPLRGVM